MKKLLLYFLLLCPFLVKSQTKPLQPVQMPQATMYYDQSTHHRWMFNGLTYQYFDFGQYQSYNQILSGLNLSVSGSTLTVSAGSWNISNTVYTLSSPANFTLQPRDSVYSRYETVYADSANNGIHIAVGILSPNPVEPSIPHGDLRAGAVLITPTGTIIIPPGPINQFVLANPLIQQNTATPWVRSLRTDTLTIGGKYILPANDGLSGQVIQTDGAGNLFFSNQAIYNAGFGLKLSANVFSVDTINVVTQTALKDTLTAHTAHIGFGLRTSNDTLKVDTLVLPFLPLNFRSNVTVHQHGDTLAFTGPIIGTPLEGVYQSNPGARESSDFAVFGSGVNTSTNPKLLISDHSTVAYRAFMRGSTSANPLSGTDYSGFIIGNQDVTAAAGGSYSMFNQIAIKPLHIINIGGATIDSAYTVNITGPATGAGVNGALKVKGGMTILDLPAITGGTSLVVDAGGNVGTGSGGGGSHIVDGSGTTAIGDSTVNLGGTLTGNFDLDLNGNLFDFHNYGSYSGYHFVTGDNPSGSRDSANYTDVNIGNDRFDIIQNKDISHQVAIFIETTPRVGFHSAIQGIDNTTHNGIEISGVNHALYWGNSLVNKSYTDSTAKAKADSVKGTISSGVTSVSGTTNRITSTGGATPVIDISSTFEALLEKVANKSTTTTLGTSNTLYPTQNAVKTYVDNAVSGVTVPTGANPTATAGTSAVNGSAVTFMRSDAAPKVDSAVFRTVANSYSLSALQTKFNGYVPTTRTLTAGLGMQTIGDLSANRTISADTTVLKSKAGALTDYNNLSGRITTNTTNIATNTSNITLKANIASPTFTGTVTIPNGGVFGTPASLTLANATGLPNAGLVNSTISGVSLGSNLNALTFDTHLTSGGSSYNGSAAVTITTDATNAATASTIVSRDANANSTINNLIQNGQSIATAAGTTTLTVGSPNKTIFTGTTTQTCVLPVASTLVFNYSISIKNSSTGVVTVQSSGGNTVRIMPAGSSAVFTCILTSGTTAASWWVDYNEGVSLTAANIWTGLNTFQQNNIVITPTDALFLQNNTLSTSGVPRQISPSLHLGAHVWNTTTTAADNYADWIQYADVTSGAAPTTTLTWASSRGSSSTPSYTTRMVLDNSGSLTLTNSGTFTTNGSIIGGFIQGNQGIFTASGGTANFNANGGTSTTTTTSTGAIYAGAATNNYRVLFNGNTNSLVANGTTYSNAIFGSTPFQVGTATTVPWAATVVANPLGTITLVGTGSVTNTASLYVGNAVATGVNNFSAWIGTGAFHLDGLTASKLVGTDANKNLVSVNSTNYLNSRTTVSDVAYTALSTDYLISYTSLTAARTVTLIALTDQQQQIIKDEAGTAGTNNITINAPSGKTIDGASSKTINTNYGNIRVYYVASSGNFFTY
jgi:hypothetical protein